MKNMKRFLAAALALTLGLAACEPEPEPLTPVLAVGQSEVTVNAAGGSAQVVYNVTNPIEGETVTAQENAEWLTVVVGERTVEFTATANDGDAERSAEVTLSYKGAESMTVTVMQGVKIAPITLALDSVTSTEVSFFATVADSNLRWVPLIVEATAWDENATDDEIFEDDMSYFSNMATYEYNCSLSQFIEMITFVGTPGGALLYEDLKPNTNYVLYTYGITLEGERTTEVVSLNVKTDVAFKGEITFNINVTEENHVLNIQIAPSHKGVAYYYDIITEETLKEWKLEYRTSDLKSCIQQHINDTIEEYLYWGDIYDAREYFDWYSNTSNVNDYYESLADTKYIVFACKWNSDCQLLGNISYVEHTTASVEPSSNIITMTLNNPGQTSVQIETTTTTDDPYVIMGVPSYEWEGYSDEEIFDWIMAYYGTFYITDYVFKGNVAGVFSGMDPDTEYTFVAFGYEAGIMTTDTMVKATTTTLPAGDPADCTFDFQVEVGATAAYVDVTPTDDAHYYYWHIYPAEYTEEDVKANIEYVIDYWYYGDLESFAYWELSQGPAAGEVSGLTPNTAYKVAATIMNHRTGEYLADVFFGETFYTTSITYSDATITLHHGKYFDGDEIAAEGGEEYADYAGWAVLPISISYTGDVADYFYTVFKYSEGMEDPELYDDSNFYSSLLNKGIWYYEAMDFALYWDTDSLLVGLVIDYDGNYSHLYREKIHLTKEGASPASEFLNPTAAPKNSAVAWTSYDKADNKQALTQRMKIERQRRATDKRFSTEVMASKKAEAKAHKAELRKESLKSKLKARKEARKADKWEPLYIVK